MTTRDTLATFAFSGSIWNAAAMTASASGRDSVRITSDIERVSSQPWIACTVVCRPANTSSGEVFGLVPADQSYQKLSMSSTPSGLLRRCVLQESSHAVESADSLPLRHPAAPGVRPSNPPQLERVGDHRGGGTDVSWVCVRPSSPPPLERVGHPRASTGQRETRPALTTTSIAGESHTSPITGTPGLHSPSLSNAAASRSRARAVLPVEHKYRSCPGGPAGPSAAGTGTVLPRTP